MTREEALTQIIDVLENVEEFDEALTTLRTPTEDETTWKNLLRNQLHLNLFQN